MKRNNLRSLFFYLSLVVLAPIWATAQQVPEFLLEANFSGIEVRNGYIYFTKAPCHEHGDCGLGEPYEGGVFKISVNGANWEDPTTWDALALGYWAGDLDVYGEYVYFADGASIFRVPKDGGDVIKLTETVTQIWELKADDTHIYWVEYGDNQNPYWAKRVPKDGGQWEVVADGLIFPRRIDLDAENVYWAQGGTVQFRPKTGGPITTIVEGPGPCSPNFVLNADYVFYEDLEHGLTRYSKATQESVQLVTGLTDGTKLAVDNQYVYLHDSAHCCPPIGGTLKQVHIDGGPITILLPDQANRGGFKTDGTAIYYIQNSRWLHRLGTSADTEGPLTSNVVADLNPVAVNTPILLTATVDDTTTGESDIAAAEYSINSGSFVSMDA